MEESFSMQCNGPEPAKQSTQLDQFTDLNLKKNKNKLDFGSKILLNRANACKGLFCIVNDESDLGMWQCLECGACLSGNTRPSHHEHHKGHKTQYQINQGSNGIRMRIMCKFCGLQINPRTKHTNCSGGINQLHPNLLSSRNEEYINQMKQFYQKIDLSKGFLAILLLRLSRLKHGDFMENQIRNSLIESVRKATIDEDQVIYYCGYAINKYARLPRNRFELLELYGAVIWQRLGKPKKIDLATLKKFNGNGILDFVHGIFTMQLAEVIGKVHRRIWKISRAVMDLFRKKGNKRQKILVEQLSKYLGSKQICIVSDAFLVSEGIDTSHLSTYFQQSMIHVEVQAEKLERWLCLFQPKQWANLAEQGIPKMEYDRVNILNTKEDLEFDEIIYLNQFLYWKKRYTEIKKLVSKQYYEYVEFVYEAKTLSQIEQQFEKNIMEDIDIPQIKIINPIKRFERTELRFKYLSQFRVLERVRVAKDLLLCWPADRHQITKCRQIYEPDRLHKRYRILLSKYSSCDQRLQQSHILELSKTLPTSFKRQKIFQDVQTQVLSLQNPLHVDALAKWKVKEKLFQLIKKRWKIEDVFKFLRRLDIVYFDESKESNQVLFINDKFIKQVIHDWRDHIHTFKDKGQNYIVTNFTKGIIRKKWIIWIEGRETTIRIGNEGPNDAQIHIPIALRTQISTQLKREEIICDLDRLTVLSQWSRICEIKYNTLSPNQWLLIGYMAYINVSLNRALEVIQSDGGDVSNEDIAMLKFMNNLTNEQDIHLNQFKEDLELPHLNRLAKYSFAEQSQDQSIANVAKWTNSDQFQISTNSRNIAIRSKFIQFSKKEFLRLMNYFQTKVIKQESYIERQLSSQLKSRWYQRIGSDLATNYISGIPLTQDQRQRINQAKQYRSQFALEQWKNIRDQRIQRYMHFQGDLEFKIFEAKYNLKQDFFKEIHSESDLQLPVILSNIPEAWNIVNGILKSQGIDTSEFIWPFEGIKKKYQKMAEHYKTMVLKKAEQRREELIWEYKINMHAKHLVDRAIVLEQEQCEREALRIPQSKPSQLSFQIERHCPLCKAEILIYQVPLQCSRKDCDWQLNGFRIHNIFRPVNIVNTGQTLEMKFVKCQLQSRRNNLREEVLKKYNTICVNEYLWSDSLPRYIETNIPFISDDDIEVVNWFYQNYDKVPIQIRQSKGMGMGVFATADIHPRTFLGHYIGEIVHSGMIDESKEDSLVQIGWIEDKLIQIRPRNFMNHGRFLNGKRKFVKENIQVGWATCILNGKSAIGLMMYAKKMIKKGQQLIWDYGEGFDWGLVLEREQYQQQVE